MGSTFFKREVPKTKRNNYSRTQRKKNITMKKLSLIVSVLAIVAIVASSCGKSCVCTRYEDGKKIYTTTDKEVKVFEKTLCTDLSVKPYQGYSQVTEGKEVTVEVKCK